MWTELQTPSSPEKNTIRFTNQQKTQTMQKDFNDWNSLKQKLDKNEKVIFFKEREVWWCSIGLNLGHEENGKNQFFTRPVLVIRKFNNHLFLGVPLTTQIKENKYYHQVTLKEETQCVMLSQMRIFGNTRMRSRLGELSRGQFVEVKRKLAEMILED